MLRQRINHYKRPIIICVINIKYHEIQRVVLGVPYDQLIDSQTNMKKS